MEGIFVKQKRCQTTWSNNRSTLSIHVSIIVVVHSVHKKKTSSGWGGHADVSYSTPKHKRHLGLIRLIHLVVHMRYSKKVRNLGAVLLTGAELSASKVAR